MDQPTLQRIASGDKAAVQICIDRYAGLVWSLARRMCMNSADAEDAVQEIFVEIWRNAYRFDPNIASETTFIAMIARRRLIDRRRKLSRQRDRAPLDDASPTRPDAPKAELGEEAQIASRAMDELGADQQRVLRLSLMQGLSHEKIATATGLPLGTVKTHARRGLLRIREMLGGNKTSGKGVNL
ncbi:MAG: sigma-70 family RNA polymerase sigma factor [Phycisphaerales bacterium]